MGFFRDFRDDITQAVNELLPEDDIANKNNEFEQNEDTQDLDEIGTEELKSNETELEDELDEMETLDNTEDDGSVMDFEIDTISDYEEEDEEKTMDDNVDLELLEAMKVDEQEEIKEEKEEVQEVQEPIVKAAAIANDVSDDEVTVISKGTTIIGSISSDCSLEIMGNVTGDIECLGKLSISGKIKGNSSAAEVFVNTERLEGNIESEGAIKVGLGTVIIGDIVASSGVIAGAIKGEIDIKGPIVIDSTAIIKGNIKAKSVQINNGAVIEGFCSLSYAEVDVDNIFE